MFFYAESVKSKPWLHLSWGVTSSKFLWSGQKASTFALDKQMNAMNRSFATSLVQGLPFQLCKGAERALSFVIIFIPRPITYGTERSA